MRRVPRSSSYAARIGFQALPELAKKGRDAGPEHVAMDHPADSQQNAHAYHDH
jgi:hypothetical protein